MLVSLGLRFNRPWSTQMSYKGQVRLLQTQGLDPICNIDRKGHFFPVKDGATPEAVVDYNIFASQRSLESSGKSQGYYAAELGARGSRL